MTNIVYQFKCPLKELFSAEISTYIHTECNHHITHKKFKFLNLSIKLNKPPLSINTFE